MSQTGGRDSRGDFAVSFGSESCFSSETQSLCVAESKYVPNIVVTMRIFREKWLRSSIGRSHFLSEAENLSRQEHEKTSFHIILTFCDHRPCAVGRGSFMTSEIEKFRFGWIEYFQESFPSCI